MSLRLYLENENAYQLWLTFQRLMVSPIRRHVFLDAIVQAVLHLIHVYLMLPCIASQQRPSVLGEELLRHRVLSSAQVVVTNRANDPIIHSAALYSN